MILEQMKVYQFAYVRLILKAKFCDDSQWASLIKNLCNKLHNP